MSADSPLFDFHTSLSSIQEVLIIGSHPDDIEIGCGGTIMRLTQLIPDLALHWVVLTASPERSAEARHAAKRFGGDSVASVNIASFRDRYLSFDPAVKEYFDDLGRRLSPDLILSPWDGDAHQDHRTAGVLAKNTFRDHLILQYEIPKYDGDLGRPSVYVRMDETTVNEKIEGLFDCFSSQQRRPWFTADTFRAMMRLRGIECKAESGLAEAFHVTKMVLG